MTYGTMPLKFHSSLCAERDKKMYRSFVFTAFLATAMSGVQAPATQTASAVAPATTSAVPAAPSTKNAPAASSKAVDKSGSSQLTASDPVITIHGLCDASSGAKADGKACNTVITKQQFDDVLNGLNALGPQLLPMQRRAVAEGYVATLINYEAAKKAGVERDPRFAEVIQLARMRAMGDMYKALMQEKANKVSPQEMEAYYKKNIDQFEELTMRRITLPRYNSANLKDDAYAAKARKVAEDIHARAAKGEDLDQLQKEAFAAMGISNPPTTKMGPVRRGLFAPEQEKQLFALKPGEVTGILEQPSSFIIFKLEGRKTLTLDQAKDEITRALIKEHTEQQEQAQSQAIKVDYNDQYIGAPQTSTWMPASALNQTEAHSSGDTKAPLKPESPK
jgi:parvulin-like peptidyl-prolyl isomerase